MLTFHHRCGRYPVSPRTLIVLVRLTELTSKLSKLCAHTGCHAKSCRWSCWELRAWSQLGSQWGHSFALQPTPSMVRWLDRARWHFLCFLHRHSRAHSSLRNIACGEKRDHTRLMQWTKGIKILLQLHDCMLHRKTVQNLTNCSSLNPQLRELHRHWRQLRSLPVSFHCRRQFQLLPEELYMA